MERDSVNALNLAIKLKQFKDGRGPIRFRIKLTNSVQMFSLPVLPSFFSNPFPIKYVFTTIFFQLGPVLACRSPAVSPCPHYDQTEDRKSENSQSEAVSLCTFTVPTQSTIQV